jgi:hypothetical protein
MYDRKERKHPITLITMNTMSMINLPANVAVIREEEDLKLLHYTDDAQHPGPADFFKGVVTAGPMVVARSF